MAPTNDTAANGLVCRIGLISRIDFGSDGFRQALLELAKEDFRREDVHYVILAGGLISARAIKDKQTRLKRAIRVTKAQAKARLKELKSDKSKKARDEVNRTETMLAELEQQLSSISDGNVVEELADDLAKRMPHFVNAKGEPVKLYIVASSAYDGDVGEEVAQILATKRPKDIRVYKAGNDDLHVTQAKKIVEVLTAVKRPWLRGDYASTPVERLLKDREKQRSDANPPDIQVVGCFGATITKPQGEAARPFVALPVLHKIDEAPVAENQIGVRVMEVWRDRTDPVLLTYSYKDYVSNERKFVTAPPNASPIRTKIVEVLRRRGKLPTQLLADAVGVKREAVEKEAKALVREGKRALKKWPGLIFYRDSKRWDFDPEWMKDELRYPPRAADRKVDSIVAYGCPHFGSTNTDYRWFLEVVPKVILERDATILVGAGDFIEGLKHNLVLRGEVYGGMNVTQQEILAGSMIAKVNAEVFRARFQKSLPGLVAKTKDGKLTREQLAEAIDAALLTNVVIPGNHDDWQRDNGTIPLEVMKMTCNRIVTANIEQLLAKHGLCFLGLTELVSRKMVEPPKNRFMLPSGLRMSILHPHMSRTKTTSIRPQEMLDKERGPRNRPGSQVVIGANFHVGEHLEMWDGVHGQRVCLQLGTLKHGTDFEDHKLKTVDQGFGYLRVESCDNRIVRTEATFYSNDPDLAKPIDGKEVFESLLKDLGLLG